jgi:hypothetical protein
MFRSPYVAGRQGGGREINECYSETKENRSWGMFPGDQRRVTSPQRLKQPMKWHVSLHGTSCTSISVTCSKWYIRKAPFVLGAQPLDMSPLSRRRLA